MKITLPVDGVEKTFSEEELIAILEKHFSTGTTQEAEEHSSRPTRPTEGVPFEVNPLEIDRGIFQEKRKNRQQENTRQMILEAFANVDKYPKLCGRPFKTLMPKKTWDWESVRKLRERAFNLGGHMANRVEQALEWAQRITNGETWEDICNKPDTANWYRLIHWGYESYRLVGGSLECTNRPTPASCIISDDLYPNNALYLSIPLVVFYK